jgi:hypothetical protein
MSAYNAAARNGGTISPGMYFAMSPEMRANYELRTWKDTYLVTNANFTVGAKVTFPAWPLEKVSGTIYDCGSPFTGNLGDFTELTIVMGNTVRIQKLTTNNKSVTIKAKSDEAVRQFKEWQKTNAGNLSLVK